MSSQKQSGATGPSLLGEDVDPFEIVPADCLDNPIGVAAGDFRFSDVDDVLAFGVPPCTRGIRGLGHDFGKDA
jgi:hypothetical protein